MVVRCIVEEARARNYRTEHSMIMEVSVHAQKS